MLCPRCKKTVGREYARKYRDETICEDCYIDLVGPKTNTVSYKGGANNGFLRLKRTYSVIKQQFD